MTAQAKTCSRCSQVRPVVDFHSNGKGRRRPECATCASKAQKARKEPSRHSIGMTLTFREWVRAGRPTYLQWARGDYKIPAAR